MSTTPALLQHRPARPYVALTLAVSAVDLPAAFARVLPDLLAWAREHGAEPSGAPFTRFRQVAMAGPQEPVDVDIGVPIARPLAEPPAGDAPVHAGVLPPGIYATLVHSGPADGLRGATSELMAWADANGVAPHHGVNGDGQAWELRLESPLGGAAPAPAGAANETEISFLTKEG